MRYVAIGLVLCALGGCAFGQGFRDKSLEMAGDITADALAEIVDKKLDADFSELKKALGEIPDNIPKPTSPTDQGMLYTLGGLVAYVVGSFGKGAIRKYGKKVA